MRDQDEVDATCALLGPDVFYIDQIDVYFDYKTDRVWLAPSMFCMKSSEFLRMLAATAEHPRPVEVIRGE